MARAADLVLSIAGLRKDLRSASSHFCLELAEFKVRRGRFYGLVGRSGSGKSTLLDLLALVSRPTEVREFRLMVGAAGEAVAYNLTAMAESAGPQDAAGDRLASALRARHYGYVLQSGGLFPFLSVIDNVELPLRMNGRTYSRARIVELARRLDIEDQLAKKPQALSGGQRQRASILRALAAEPSLLLADEPTAAVDEAMAGIILHELKSLAVEQATTVVLVSHDQALVDEFADEATRLIPVRHADGRVVTQCALGGT
jgi:putative ABC transport system ATP-binding protein